MRILHYSLGFPPFRSGGLIKYCTDLMLSQKSRGETVALLWPGQINQLKKFSIKQRRDQFGIESLEIINPLPIPYDEGIRNVAPFMENRDQEILLQFLRDWSPDVIHIHTIMGLPEELLDAAAQLDIQTIFTTHDYFPICPMVNLYYQGSHCIEEATCNDCPQHNSNGLSQRKIALLQSPVYRRYKDSGIIRKLREKHRKSAAHSANTGRTGKPATVPIEDYRRLRARNMRILGKCSIIHANSSISAAVYHRYLPSSKIRTLPITHRDVHVPASKRFERQAGPVRIGYLGPATDAKGYFLLLDSLRELRDQGYEFELNVYGAFDSRELFLRRHPQFNYREIDDVFAAIDVLVVPSKWSETFGFTALESLSRGVPVLVSECAGVKDVVDDRFGLVFAPTVSGCRAAILECLQGERLSLMRQAITMHFVPPELADVERELYLKEVE